MVNAQTHRRFLIRRVIAVAALCLFALRGAAFIGMATSLATTDTDNPVFAHAVLGDHCARQDGSDGPGKRAHPDHCVLCCSVAREVAMASASIFAAMVLRAPDEPSAAAPRARDIPKLEKPPGLIANWSATSPPRLNEIRPASHAAA